MDVRLRALLRTALFATITALLITGGVYLFDSNLLSPLTQSLSTQTISTPGVSPAITPPTNNIPPLPVPSDAAPQPPLTENPAPVSKPTPAPKPSHSPTSSPAPATPSSHPTPRTDIAWGAYAGDNLGDAAVFESLVGKNMNMQSVFVGWSDDEFPSRYGPTVRDEGKTLIVFWEQYGASLDDIIAGRYDDYIDTFARDAKAYGGPVILAPLHEMNDDGAPWDGTVGMNSASKLIATWRHIHDHFVGVSNVSFAWVVNSNSVPDMAANSIPAYYPGDQYVDIVGIDGFNFGDPWETFNDIFTAPLTTVAAYHKPIYLMSMGCAESPQKATWITDFGQQLARHPEIKGWVWFNKDKEEDWRINSDLASLTAFKAILP